LLDSISMMSITLPLVFPVAVSMGWNPIWFAMLVIMAIEIGLVTPPVGLNVYTVKAVAGPEVKMEDLFRAVFPFFILMLIALAILIAFPKISTWLPGLMFKK
jgi:C4-dicarboxylate transporter, DctM subunit